MTSYTPREGDTVRVTLTTAAWHNEQAGCHGGLAMVRPADLAVLIGAGMVELVARAEPDWQPGQIGKHVETGELFIFDPPAHVPTLWPWLRLAHKAGTHGARRLRAEELAGKLVRCTVTPEDGEAWPWPYSRCVAHGTARCPGCHQNPSTCNTAGADPGCGVYAETGMHWDTCRNRVRG